MLTPILTLKFWYLSRLNCAFEVEPPWVLNSVYIWTPMTGCVLLQTVSVPFAPSYNHCVAAYLRACVRV